MRLHKPFKEILAVIKPQCRRLMIYGSDKDALKQFAIEALDLNLATTKSQQDLAKIFQPTTDLFITHTLEAAKAFKEASPLTRVIRARMQYPQDSYSDTETLNHFRRQVKFFTTHLTSAYETKPFSRLLIDYSSFNHETQDLTSLMCAYTEFVNDRNVNPLLVIMTEHPQRKSRLQTYDVDAVQVNLYQGKIRLETISPNYTLDRYEIGLYDA